jgi:signal transduction histidine kinase
MLTKRTFSHEPSADALLDGVACGVIICQAVPGANPAYMIRLINTAAERVTGYNRMLVKDRPLTLLVDQQQVNTLSLASSSASNSTHFLPIWLKHRNDHRFLQSVAIACQDEQLTLTFPLVGQEFSLFDVMAGVIQQSPNGIVVYRAKRDGATQAIVDYQTIFYNARVLDVTGYEETELRELGLFERQPDARRLAASFQALVEQGEPIDWEYYNPRLQRWFEVQCKPLGDGFFTLFRDLTQLKEAHKQQQQQAELLTRILDTSLSGLLACEALRDSQGRIVDFRLTLVNQAVRAMVPTGQSLEAGRQLSDFYPANEQPALFDRYVQVVETGEPFTAELHYKVVNEWYHIAVAKLGDGYVASLTQLTANKQTEQLLHQQAQLLQSVLDTTSTAVVTYYPLRGEEGQIIDFHFGLANQAALSILGLTHAQLQARTLLELSMALESNTAFVDYIGVIQTGQPFTFERYFRNRWFLTTAARLGTDGLITSTINITAIKQAQEQIEQLNDQLQHSNARLNQFASVASHDLQEPLRKINSFGNILIDQYGPALGDGLNLLIRMQTAASRMQTLIRDLLTYSRLSMGSPVDYQSIDLNRILGEVLVDLEIAIGEKNAVVEVVDLPTITGDALQLRQVFQNLLSNALKFTRPGQQPRVTLMSKWVNREDLPMGLPVSGWNLNPPAYWQITVADNGIGFDEKYQDRIFSAFERLHSKSSPYGGSGIGLAIVRQVMDNHLGAVRAHSVAGEGATFTLYLPACP